MFRSPLPGFCAIGTALALGAFAVAAADAACTAPNANPNVPESTPTTAFKVNGDGTVTHALTGLMWKQCPQGLGGATCAAGTAQAMTWREALASATADRTAGYSDWRLPNAREIGTLFEYCGYLPALNTTVFPGAKMSVYWTGTTFRSDATRAWVGVFYSGGVGTDAKSTVDFVRLVRGGQAFDSADAQSLKPGVVEYVNTADFPGSPGGHFFYSSDAQEQAAVDSGAAGRFARTGRLFLTGGTSAVCRFYGSMSPGPNSHFFTVDAAECNALIAAQIKPVPTSVQQWNYEGLSYQTTPVSITAGGSRSCPSGTLPLYRAYNNAFSPAGAKNPWDSNHRYTPRSSDIAAMAALGWRDEGIVFCTPSQ